MVMPGLISQQDLGFTKIDLQNLRFAICDLRFKGKQLVPGNCTVKFVLRLLADCTIFDCNSVLINK